MDKNILRRRILLLLYAGIALGFASSPFRQYKVFGEFAKEWKKIGEQNVAKQVKPLARSKFLKIQKDKNGRVTITITEKGKLRALKYYFENMRISSQWDEKWRIVIFDIPEKRKVARNALRRKLKALGFIELQKSVFIFPYECQKEIACIVDFFSLKPYVRYGVLESVDNQLYLKKLFHLT